MIGLRIHAGYVVLAAVFLVAAASIVLQNEQLTPAAAIPSGRSVSVSPSRSGFSGIARVIDGDTIAIHGARVRLNGIDAPETKQTCVANDREYQCGLAATEALIQLIGSNTVDCEQTGTDRNGRAVARCMVNSTDVGAWMVEHGWAVAYRRYSLAYVDQESRARELKLGMWAGSFTAPEEWRRLKREGEIQ
ncbi:thermonuclease family protein [Bradyrhizobium sp. SZCCHNPS2010]|uniref:thermonuclease family protein n=1 Tax=Bradyrhizobium sp. SZCCHNPS2010 TaxID=3057333 RepID=UPI002916AEA4|nr:thermonuclease family protein [Bradyrhizobium sp. SZCCHNPS2010]